MTRSPNWCGPAGGRIIGGVAVGIADHLSLKVLWVRLTFAMLALVSGVGVLAYALLWMFVPQSRSAESTRPSSTERRQAIGIAAVGAALAVLGTAFGLGESVGWIVGPLGLAAVGAAFVWREADDAQRQRWRRSAAGVVGESRSALWRLFGGAVLVVGGLAVFAFGQFDVGATGGALVAVVLTLVGVAIIAIPWWIRLVRDLGAERRELVVQQERAEIAAHLHDSVLQTLALIQRQAADPREVLRLSRCQERELRSWLYGPAGYASSRHAGPVETTGPSPPRWPRPPARSRTPTRSRCTPVVVGDTAVRRSDMHALVAAAREAMVNAAKHAGDRRHQPLRRGRAGRGTVFVRDRGVGFDPERWTPTGVGWRSRSAAGWTGTAAGRPSGRTPARAPRSSCGCRSARRPRRAGRVRAAGSRRDEAGRSADEPAGHRLPGRRPRPVPGRGARPSWPVWPTTDRSGRRGRDRRRGGRRITAERPDVVLLDVHMPDGGGRAVLDRCTAQLPGSGVPGAVGVRRGRGRHRRHPGRRPRLRHQDDLRAELADAVVRVCRRRRGVLPAAGRLRAGRLLRPARAAR